MTYGKDSLGVGTITLSRDEVISLDHGYAVHKLSGDSRGDFTLTVKITRPRKVRSAAERGPTQRLRPARQRIQEAARIIAQSALADHLKGAREYYERGQALQEPYPLIRNLTDRQFSQAVNMAMDLEGGNE